MASTSLGKTIVGRGKQEARSGLKLDDTRTAGGRGLKEFSVSEPQQGPRNCWGSISYFELSETVNAGRGGLYSVSDRKFVSFMRGLTLERKRRK